MHELEASGVFLQEFRGIRPSVFRPEHIQLETNPLRVGLRNQIVEERTVRGGHEFVSVWVIAELKPRFLDFCACLVKYSSRRFYILRGELPLVGYPGAHNG